MPPLLPKSDIDPEHCRVSAQLDDNVSVCGAVGAELDPSGRGSAADLRLMCFCVSPGAQVDDNIPLRVMLLLMDEVFDLKEKNQWLRRNIKNLLQQLIRATYGDTINRSGRALEGGGALIIYSVGLWFHILHPFFFIGKLWITWTT